jgi:hypothetical protein
MIAALMLEEPGIGIDIQEHFQIPKVIFIDIPLTRSFFKNGRGRILI